MNFKDYYEKMIDCCENRLDCLKQFKLNTGYSYNSKKGKSAIAKSNKFIKRVPEVRSMDKYRRAMYISMLDSSFQEYTNNLIEMGIDNDTFIVKLTDFKDKLTKYFNSEGKNLKFITSKSGVSLDIDGTTYVLEDEDFICYKIRNLANFDHNKDIELLALTSPYYEELQKLEKDYPEIRKIYYELIENNVNNSYKKSLNQTTNI